MRVYELARLLGISSRELLGRLRADGEWLTSHMSLVPEPRVRLMTTTSDAAGAGLPPLTPARNQQAANISPPGADASQPWQRSFIEALPRSYWRRKPGPTRPTFIDPSPTDDYDDSVRYGPELTTRDVAILCGVTPATVRMWVRRGHITPTRTYRNSNVFDTEAVLSAHEAIRSRSKPARPEPPSQRPTWQVVRPVVNIPTRYHDKVVSIREAAHLAQVRPATIRTWIHRGHLRPLPGTPSREVRLRVGDVFKAARRRRA
jgi:hypothetical protein